MLVQMPEHMGEHPLGPVGGVLNGIVTSTQSHLWLNNWHQTIVLQNMTCMSGPAAITQNYA